MKTAAVIVDSWKVPIFKKHLDAAGYSYEVFPGLTPDTDVMKVKYEWVAKLKPIIEAAQKECANGPKADAERPEQAELPDGDPPAS